ncbi:efflux transporter outer membrane subunit [Methyloversatilis thermotolerans]|uniref:efflux transporter outer membrane subunit n=1 Tax=Methyloversatilis thermotolerans TaxID=1346290 RepID=UPI0003790FD4|nr:efflux transporter outer membrane subunit [Methyloversatilis thermotolerans]
MASRPSLIGILLAVPLTACTVGPDFVQPDAPLGGERFVGDAALASRLADSRRGDDDDRWWAAFGDPVLDHLIAEAQRQNLDLAAAAARLDQARAAAAYATAKRLPASQISGEANIGKQSLQAPFGRLASNFPGYDRTTDSYALNAGASWELDLFGGLRRGAEASAAELQAAAAATDAVRIAISAHVADSYIAIRTLQAQRSVLDRQIETQRRLLELVTLLNARGLVADLQKDQSEAALASVEAERPALDAALDAALNGLDILLGAQPGTWRDSLSAPADIPAAPAVDTAGGPASLLRRRPDLFAAERRVAAANARIGVATADYYPQLSLSALFGFATAGGGGLISSGAQQYQLGTGLRWRLFDFGRVDAAVAQAQGQRAEALAAYRLAALRATEEVENALSALLNREQQAQRLEDAESAQARARAAAEAAWRSGTVSLIEVLDADSRLLRARQARLDAQSGAARAAVACFRALGGGWNAPAATDGPG